MKLNADTALDLVRLPADLQEQAMTLLAHKDDIILRLESLVKDYREALFGAKSEKADPEQYALAFEDIEIAIACVEAKKETSAPEKQKKPRKVNRGRLPKHLPRD